MYYLGIDGGGSQTRALLSDASGQIHGHALSGPTNPRATPADEWRRQLLDAIRQACGGIDPADIRAAHLGLAGAGEASVQKQVADAACEVLRVESTRLTVGHDLETALEGGLAGGSGIVLVAGTGSACFGRNADGRTAESGGWGEIVDDAGGGGWLGLRALQVCVRQADGRLTQSRLMAKVLAFLGIDSMAGFKTRIHDHGLPRKERAQLAPVVLELAASGDAAAREIVTEAVGELRLLAVSVARQLRMPRPVLVVCGGLSGDAHFSAALAAALQDGGVSVVAPRLSAVAGAVLLAMKSVDLVPGGDAISRLSGIPQ